MLRTNLEVWKSTLFVSLGLAAGGCGGAVGSEALDSADDPPQGRSPSGGAGSGADDMDAAPSGDTRSKPPVVLHEALRCEEGAPIALGRGLMQCQNGIVHRPAGASARRSPDDTCASDDDCSPGALCIASATPINPIGACSAGNVGYRVTYREHFACQTANDECAVVAECGVAWTNNTCALVDGVRYCTPNFPCGEEPVTEAPPVPGRPFLVEGEVRVAPVRRSDDWCGPALATVRELDAASLAVAARHWQAAAQMEHASIAAFARFTLQLLQLGAPHELCLASQQAMRDETEHARLCFALASRYAGAPLGPGGLPLAGALEEMSLATIARVTFLEGCLGETHAALEAAESLALATDPDVQHALGHIAADEQRHAELAWRFIAWAIERDSTGEVRRVLQGELRRVLAEHALSACTSHSTPADASDALTAHGILTTARRRELRRAALRDVILPCAERLTSRRGARSDQAADARV